MLIAEDELTKTEYVLEQATSQIRLVLKKVSKNEYDAETILANVEDVIGQIGLAKRILDDLSANIKWYLNSDEEVEKEDDEELGDE